MSGSQSRKLREKLHAALRRERLSEALRQYEALQEVEPQEARWPHRKGDLLKRLGRPNHAVEAYEQAIDLYAQQGFVARAAAMAKVVMGIAPERVDVLSRVKPDAARKLHRSSRSAIVTADLEPEPEGQEITHTQKKRISTDALPLIANPSTVDDALRFSTPPGTRRPTLDLDISDVELQDRPRLGEDSLDERPTPEHLAQLPSVPLFAEIPHPMLARIVQESRLIVLEPGESLIERGTTADALYVLVEGSVQLIRAIDEDVMVLSEGDVVGISCLLERVCYEGDVTAQTKVSALRVSKLLLDRLVEEHPPLGDILLEMLGRRLVSTLIRTAPMFAGLDNGTRSEVAAMFEVRRAHRGTSILEAGKRSDGLYIPMIGDLSAIGADGEELGRLKLGRALGQHSILTRTPSPVTVMTDSDVLVLRMSARRFHEVASAHPTMVTHLEELALRPDTPTFSLVPAAQRKSSA
ncbi:MAG: cyclic nucleotide-binding domain-containing protein [Polyangiales bacterium]